MCPRQAAQLVGVSYCMCIRRLWVRSLMGMYVGGHRLVFVSHTDVSSSLSPTLPLSKINKHTLGEDFLKSSKFTLYSTSCTL